MLASTVFPRFNEGKMALLSARLLSSINISLLKNLSSTLTSLRLSSRLSPKDEIIANSVSTEVTHRIDDDYKSVFKNVNNLLSSQNSGRLFAVVHLCGKQFKITSGDIILVEGYWPPTIGDRISLEKVLLVGGNDFTLFGRPILGKELVDVQATVIEKTLTHTKTHFKKKRRKQYVRINFQRSPNTMIRINSIEISGKVNESNEDFNPVKMF